MTRSSRPTGRTDRIDAEASLWVARVRLGQLDARGEAQAERWLSADPAHDETYLEMEGVADDIATLKHLAQLAPIREAPSRSGLFQHRWVIGAATTAFACVTAVALVILPGRSGPAPAEMRYATPVGQSRVLRLEDGTEATIAPGSIVVARFTDKARNVEVVAGEAVFDVAARHGAPPFVVHAGGIEIRDIGTRFNVRLAGSAVDVAVISGAVEMSSARFSLFEQPTVRLSAGQSGRLEQASVFRPAPAPSVESTAARAEWPSGILVYEDAPLSEIVSDLNRYIPGEVTIEGREIGDLRLTTSFRTDQTDMFLGTLSNVLPLSVSGNAREGYRISAVR